MSALDKDIINERGVVSKSDRRRDERRVLGRTLNLGSPGTVEDLPGSNVS
jgi:hypothetical protein